MIISSMLSPTEKDTLKQQYISRFWHFVNDNGAEATTENGRLCLVMGSEHIASFIETFCVDDDVVNCKIKDKKLHVEARWIVPFAKDSEIIAGKEQPHEDCETFCADCIIG